MSVSIQALEKILQEHNQPKFRLGQIKKAIYQDGVSSFSEISTIPEELRERLDAELKILPFEAIKVLISKDERSIKALLELQDNKYIETVLISPKPDVWSVCVSTQVGCPMGCLFCATGKTKFKRNLTAEEITGQFLFWKQYLNNNKTGAKISNVVYMGMGEPFLNWEPVKESLRNLIQKDLFGFGSRSISVSTVAVPQGIAKFVDEFPQMNLAISLHFANDQKRSQWMPANKKFNLDDIRKNLQDYFKVCNRKVFIEYIMLEKINDRREDAEELVQYLKSIGNVHLLHVNLISYNVTRKDLEPSSREKTIAFKNYLLQNGINATIRKSLGLKIQGACGQLVGKQTTLQ